MPVLEVVSKEYIEQVASESRSEGEDGGYNAYIRAPGRGTAYAETL